MVQWTIPKVFQNVFSQPFEDGLIYKLVETFRTSFTFFSSSSLASAALTSPPPFPLSIQNLNSFIFIRRNNTLGGGDVDENSTP
jgi:hypothetical protein